MPVAERSVLVHERRREVDHRVAHRLQEIRRELLRGERELVRRRHLHLHRDRDLRLRLWLLLLLVEHRPPRIVPGHVPHEPACTRIRTCPHPGVECLGRVEWSGDDLGGRVVWWACMHLRVGLGVSVSVGACRSVMLWSMMRVFRKSVELTAGQR